MDPRNDEATARLDVIVIGGGQTGLALGFFLRRTGLSYVILDREPIPGGAWPHAWNSLRLFSPAAWSSLPGWQIPATAQGNPSREEVIDYLGQYEQRYGLPVIRPVTVSQVQRAGDGYRVVAEDGRQWQARAVLSATGTWSSPFIPDIPGRDLFHGRQLHSAHYAGPQPFAGERVAINGIAANRDPRVFGNPDEFRLERDPALNLLYGAGIHVCPGAPLARLELAELIEEVLARTPSPSRPAPATPRPAPWRRTPATLRCTCGCNRSFARSFHTPLPRHQASHTLASSFP